MPENILNFFRCLRKNLPKSKHTYVVYETLFRLEMARGKLKNAHNILYSLRKVFTHDQYKVKINQLEKILQTEKEERINRRTERRKTREIGE